MKIPPKTPFLYPEDKIAISFSIPVIIIQVYYFSAGFIKDFSQLITPVLFFIILLALVFIQRKSSSKILKFIRSYIHIPYYGIIFSAFQTYIHKLNPNDYDTLLLKWDQSVFGFDVTVWLEKFTSNGLTEVLTLSYFSYYILPTLTFILLFFTKENGSFVKTRNYLLAIITGWYGAFIFYLLLPAAGPDIAFPEHYKIPLQGLSPLTNSYLENLAKYLRESFVRNTFPSMHFGIILITNFFAFIYKRKYFWFCTLPLGTMLAIATVYLRQHYLIDLAGSFPVAAISIYSAFRLNSRKKPQD